MRKPEKKIHRLLVSILFTGLFYMLIGCGSKKELSAENLFGPIWEMEYLSGPGIQLSSLFEYGLPHIQFDKADQRVFGSTGCNGYNAGFKLEGNSVSFGEPGISTKMYCGEGENEFKRAMKDVDRWSISEDGKLFLLKGENPLIRFRKQ